MPTNGVHAHLEEFQWKKGQSGNPKGRPPNAHKLESYVSQVLDEKVNGVRRIEVLSRVIVDEMINGRNTALTKAIMDRLWPAVAQLALQDGGLIDQIAASGPAIELELLTEDEQFKMRELARKAISGGVAQTTPDETDEA